MGVLRIDSQSITVMRFGETCRRSTNSFLDVADKQHLTVHPSLVNSPALILMTLPDGGGYRVQACKLLKGLEALVHQKEVCCVFCMVSLVQAKPALRTGASECMSLQLETDFREVTPV